ncbi:MAG: hypothetical protein COU68_03105, partial [Candidatus Pacebacteria bacterium CG10_big_fil_rev_8_21_14_0_10_45_6]
NTLKIALAGTTHRTAQCAEALQTSSDFSIAWVLTPEPKPIGRKKIITANPLQLFAESQSIPVISIKNRISSKVKTSVLEYGDIDLLLVVDFGYIVPEWLLDLPSIAPINIHPSELPKWRGSSPGQFVLLHGNKNSAITLIKMNSKLDQGPIIAALPFTVNPSWTAEDYYAQSFDLLCPQLASLILKYTNERLETEQPQLSPTPTAEKIAKNDTFIPWDLILQSTNTPNMEINETQKASLSPILVEATKAHQNFAALIAAATRAFSPWPKVWTRIPTKQGEKRMQLHSVSVDTSAHGDILSLEMVQIEGQSPAQFNQIRTSILNQ